MWLIMSRVSSMTARMLRATCNDKPKEQPKLWPMLPATVTVFGGETSGGARAAEITKTFGASTAGTVPIFFESV